MPFFAKKVVVPQNWIDHKLNLRLKEKIEAIEAHLLQSKKTHQKFDHFNKVKRGIRILFIGISKQEKMYTAMLLSKSIGKDLFRINLSEVVSKYIGETEKNLKKIFDAAENGGAILLFDEADALFGKRSKVKDSHDRFTNVDSYYLLQQMEDYHGITILASNLKNDIDDAFLRRFDFIFHFPINK